MTTPTIVQSAFGRSASTFTVTLSSLPTIGNSLLVIAAGYNGIVWTLSQPLPVINYTNASGQLFMMWYGPVCAKTQTTSFTINPQGISFVNMGVFELLNANPYVPADRTFSYSVATTAVTTLTTPSLTSPQSASELRLAMFEWNTSSGVSSVPSGWTLLSPTSWYGGVNGHSAGIWSIPTASSGTYSLTMSSVLDITGAVYGDVEIVPAGTSIIIPVAPDRPSVAQGFVGSSLSKPVTTTTQKKAGNAARSIGTATTSTTQKAGFQSVSGAFYGSGYLGQWSPAAASKAITGVVQENGSPVARLVVLYNRTTGDYVAQTFSSATTGSYTFAGLNPKAVYMVMAYDAASYNALIYDYVIPS